MILDVIVQALLVDGAIFTLAAREDALQARVFVLHVCLQRDRLDARVAAILTLVRLAAGVAHAVSAQSVVISRLIVAHVTPATRWRTLY